MAPSAVVSNNKYLIVAFLIRADPRKFLLFFFSWVLLKTVFEVNRQHPTFLAPFFRSLLYMPLQGNPASFLISYLGPQMEVHPEEWPHPAGQCHLAGSMISFLSALVMTADRAAIPEVSQAAGAHMPGGLIAFIVPTANDQVVVTDLLISLSLCCRVFFISCYFKLRYNWFFWRQSLRPILKSVRDFIAFC